MNENEKITDSVINLSNVEKRYIWLAKHLIWNGPKQKDGVYWVKITKEDASLLEEKYEVCETRTLKGGIKANVIKMCDNFIVLDTR